MNASRAIFILCLFVVACGTPPRAPSSATDTARLDERAKAHASTMDAHLDAIESAVPLVGGEGIAAPLAAARAEEDKHQAATVALIQSTESKANAAAAESEKLRKRIADLEATKFGILRWVLAGGLLAAAVGVGLCFTPLARLFGAGIIAAGLAAATLSIAFELAIPWLKWAVPFVVLGSGLAIVWQVWQNRRAITEVVKTTEIAKLHMPKIEADAVFANAGVANNIQSPATKRLVASIRERLEVRPLTDQQIEAAKGTP